ncbi:MAG: calcium/sodium antiporter [Gemmatimonadetes bacterium]|nr:calcium/sodium antiporter [Gemmatimonadota bacterium]
MDFLQLAGGFIYLLMGADLLVRGSVALARRLGIPSVFVALTVVALGTSLPELVVAVRAAVIGVPGLVLGNSVGSNIANVFLVIGASAMIHPLVSDDPQVRRDSVVMILVSLLLIGLCRDGGLRTGDAAILLVAMLIVTITTLRAAGRERESERSAPVEWVLGLPSQRRMITLFIAAGLVGLPVGARMVVESSVRIAAELGVSNALVGLTVVAFSTSLPELATTGVAAYQKRTEMALGTVVGSNILNIVAILGVAGLASRDPIPVPTSFFVMDFPVMIAASVLLAAFAWRRKPVGRMAGGFMFTAYVVYILAVFVTAA